MIPFKKGAFSVGAKIKMTHIKYESPNFYPCLNFMPVFDFLRVAGFQWKYKVTLSEIEGNFYPKKFTTWEEFAEETRKLMGKAFKTPLLKGKFKDYFEFEKKVSPFKYPGS